MINFKQTYNRADFLHFLETDFLPEDFLIEEEPINFESNYTRNVIRLGECKSLELDVFEVQHTSTHDARVGLSKEAFRLIYNRSTKNKALVVFVPINNPETFRFSLVAIEVELDEHKVRKSFSNPRRYSYLLGEEAKVHTPTKYLSLKGRVKDAKDLQNRFSVEVLTKEFYNELFAWYQWALSDEIGVTLPNDRSLESDDRKIEEHLIRLITRLMFVWFIKQKKLVPDLLFEADQLKSLLSNFEATDNKQDTFYRAILQNLFFATLNNKIEERAFAADGNFQENRVQYGIKTLFRYADDFSVPKEQVIQIFSKVPFLNGGLFECLDKDTPDSNGKIMYSDGFSRKKGRQSRAFVPNILFFEPEKGILSILNKYNFTIEENSPLDIEVALDPELLGKVFENLLGTYNPETKETARKQSGSFYTPREIVQYMVDESLVAHLKRTVGDELEDEYRKLINPADDTVQLTDLQKSDIFNSLKACKILDPACGSGAFPMGILNRMLAIITKLPIPEDISLYDLKLNLIENCIYGIDIQSIAVQISKLRFFISLICEQQPNADSADNFGIKPLPNLETKFVAANTLIGLTPKNAQRNLFEDPQIDVTRAELMQIRHKHFLASTAKQKKECRDEDKKLREKLAKLLDVNGNFAPDDARQLADWNPYDQNARSNFFDTEWMFGLTVNNSVQNGNFQSSEISALNLQIEAINKQITAINYSLNQNHEPEILKLQFITANLQVSIIEAELTNIRNNIAELFGSIDNKISNISREPENITYLINSLNTAIKEVNKKITKIESELQPVKQIETGGYFDIVIGNPPYIKEYTERKAFDGLRNSTYYQGKMDLWYMFACSGIDMLADNGSLCFIATNNWVTNGGASKMRNKIIEDSKIVQLVDFGNFMIFENASIQTMVMIFARNKQTDNYTFDFRKLNGDTKLLDALDLLKKNNNNKAEYLQPTINRLKVKNSFLTFNADDGEFILNKIYTKGNFLLDSKFEVAQGIVFPQDFLNKKNQMVLANKLIVGQGIFALLDQEKQALELSDNELRLIKPYYTTEQVHQYFTDNRNTLWLIYTDSKFKNPGSMQPYPKLKEHLDRFESVITSDNRPYGLHRARDERFFKGEKIIVQRKCVGRPSFSYTDFDCYVSATFYVIKTNRLNQKYLLGLLNSKLIEFWLKNKGKMQGNNFQLDKEPLLDIPILTTSNENQQPFITLVDRILSAKQANPKADTSTMEKEIDRLVYELYGLTEEEIAIVENKK